MGTTCRTRSPDRLPAGSLPTSGLAGRGSPTGGRGEDKELEPVGKLKPYSRSYIDILAAVEYREGAGSWTGCRMLASARQLATSCFSSSEFWNRWRRCCRYPCSARSGQEPLRWSLDAAEPSAPSTPSVSRWEATEEASVRSLPEPTTCCMCSVEWRIQQAVWRTSER